MNFSSLLGLSVFGAILTACSSAAPDDFEGPRGSDGAGASAASGAEIASTSLDALCPASPAPAIFGNALCVCGDFKMTGNLLVKSGSPGSLGSVGVNGTSQVVANASVTGSWGSGKGFSAAGLLAIGKSLYTAGDMSVMGNVTIGENLAVGGKLSGVGLMSIDGELRAKSGGLLGLQKSGGRGTYEDPPGPPCGCEHVAGYLDVAAAISAARETNDNQAAGLGGELANVGSKTVELPSGRYYVPSFASVGNVRFRATGAVSFHVDGDIASLGNGAFDVAEGATLDLYVGGVIRQLGNLRIGSAARPTAVRIYLGGESDVTMNVGNQAFFGAVYAPRAHVKYTGNTLLHGGLFAQALDGVGNVEIRGSHPEEARPCSDASKRKATDRDQGSPRTPTTTAPPAPTGTGSTSTPSGPNAPSGTRVGTPEIK